MSSNLVVASQATASPTTSGVSVSVSAVLDYKGTPISVNSGDLAQLRQGNFNFQLTQPVDLGPVFPDFLTWLQSTLGLTENLAQDVQDVINTLMNSSIGIVRDIGNALNSIYNATITITVLQINLSSGAKTFKFGVTMTLQPPLELFSGLSFNSLGVLIGNTGATGSPS
jgi:hypothetical protein